MNKIIAVLSDQPWAMEPFTLNNLFGYLWGLEFPSDIEISVEPIKMQIRKRTAIINITGILLKEVPSIFNYFGIEATSYSGIREQLASALNNSDVDSIFLNVDSPGGTVAGADETADTIAEAAKQKNVVAHIQDLGASGAYYLASQAAEISAGINAEVGAIGVYSVYYDYSKKLEKEGVETVVTRSGEYKGVGVVGAPITENQKKAEKVIIDGMADNFIKAVARGRNMSIEKVKELADGRTWLSVEAQKLKLIDKIVNIDMSNVNLKGNTMTEKLDNQTGETEAQKTKVDVEAAKAEAVKQANHENIERLNSMLDAFPEGQDFALEQYKAGKTIEQAKAAYCDVLSARLKEAEKKNKKNNNNDDVEGGEPVPHNEGGPTSRHDFIRTAKSVAAEQKISVTEAMKQVKREQPELYEQFRDSQQPVRSRKDE